MKQLTSPSARKWQHYNRWRAKNRALDRQRRLERIAARKAQYAADYVAPVAPKPKRLPPFARVRIAFADGTSAGFAIHETPFGLSISPTTAGHKLSSLLANK